MNIAIIRKNYTDYGGAENYLRLTAQELAAKGHHVKIFSSSRWPKPFSVSQVKILKKPSFLANILFALVIRAELKKEPFDCILSFERTFYQDIYRAGDGCHKEWLNRRSIVEPSIKKASFRINPHHRMMLYLERRCLLESGIIIANSMMAKQDIMRHYPVPEDRISVIYNGVDLEIFSPLRKHEKMQKRRSYGIKEEKVVLFVGADFRRKGLPSLLNAFSSIDGQNVKLIIAGKHPGPEHLELVKNLGVDKNIIFWGPENNIAELYSIADIFVLPTLYDPFSNATLEAMASGLSVVTTVYNGASELIEDGFNGFVIHDPLNHAALAGKMLRALLSSDDVGVKARVTAEEYPLEKAIDKMVCVMSERGNQIGRN